MSASCERVLEVEDLILGLDVSDDLEGHVETCVECKEASAMFAAERALFEARPVVAPPPLVMPHRTTLLRRIGRIGASRSIPALAGLAAAVVALIGGRPFARHDDCAAPVPVVTARAHEEGTDVLTCKEPESPAPAMSLASQDSAPLACEPSESATCDVPAWLRVTSSIATP